MAKPCPVCSTISDIPVGAVDDRRLLICPECRHVYWQAPTTPEQLRSYYEGEYSAIHRQADIQNENREYYRSHFDELRARLAESEASRPIRCVVDFGCSYPVFLEEARALGAERAVGVDFSLAVRQAGEHVGLEMWDPEAFLEEFDSEVDVIRFSHVIEHMRDPVGTFSAAVARLAPGGIAYVTQPIFPVLAARPNALPFQDAVFPEHLHFFNPISLSRLIGAAGLAVQQLFAFQDEAEIRSLYEVAADLAYLESELPPDIGGTVPDGFSPLGGRPTFYGRNCKVIARKPHGPVVSRAANAKPEAAPTAPGASPVTQQPSAAQLRELVDAGRYAEAVGLLGGVDLTADCEAVFAYYAGVSLGSVGQTEPAIALLKRAAAGGYAAFWCAYHLGLFEIKRGNRVNAAYYLAAARAAEPERADIDRLLMETAPDISLAVLPRPARADLPSAEQLMQLARCERHAEAAALLDGIDFSATDDADLLYYAGVCLGAAGQHERAIELLKRAAAGGFAAFWCAYHLALFEMRRGRPAAAACYYAIALILDPQREDIYPLLAQVAPNVDASLLREAQSGVRSAQAARAALALATASAAQGRFGAAAFYCAAALALDPANEAARARLDELAPDVSLALL